MGIMQEMEFEDLESHCSDSLRSDWSLAGNILEFGSIGEYRRDICWGVLPGCRARVLLHLYYCSGHRSSHQNHLAKEKTESEEPHEPEAGVVFSQAEDFVSYMVGGS